MANKSVQMKHHNGAGWDNLYPIALLENVFDANGKSIKKRFESLSVSVTEFGAKGDGITDDTQAIKDAIAYVLSIGGGIVFFPYGTYLVSSTITLPKNIILQGVGRRLTTIIKKIGMNVDLIKTTNFDVLTGTTVDGKTMQTNFGILDMTLNGNYMIEDTTNEQFTSYGNTAGGGIKIYGRRYKLDCEVINMAGVGVWLEGKYTEGSPLNETKDYDVWLEIRDCKAECFILKGPADGRIHQLWARGAGRRIYVDQDKLPVLASPTYAGYEHTDNIVFDGAGAEIGMIHTWGAYSGKGLRTIGVCRLLADLIISESCMSSGILLDDGAYGQISNLKVHGCGGSRDGSDPDVWIKTNRLLNISSLNQEARDVNSGQTMLKIEGSFCTIDHVTINMSGYAGHAIDIGGNYNTVSGVVNNGTGNGNDATPSTGVIRRSPYNDRTFNIDVMVVGFPLAFKSEGKAFYEYVKIVADLSSIGMNVFSGDIPDYGAPTKWDIIANQNGVYKTSEFYGTGTFDPTLTTEQTIVVPHTLLGAPPLHKIMLSLQDTPSNLSNTIRYMLVSAVSDTDITLKVRMDIAQGSNTSPKINIFARL